MVMAKMAHNAGELAAKVVLLGFYRTRLRASIKMAQALKGNGSVS